MTQSNQLTLQFELPPSPKLAFQPTMMTTQNSLQAEEAGEGSQVDSQSRRYPLRSRNSGLSQEGAGETSTAVAPTASTILRKRGRELEDAVDASTLKRQMRSSATMGLLDLGDIMTPSPAGPSRF